MTTHAGRRFMRACILSIGSELILGQLTDSNATFLAQELSAAGVDLVHVIQVGDDRRQLADAIRHVLQLADFVICTGGIGPTDDDCTREAIADVVDETPSIDPDLLANLTTFFNARGQDMPERNAKQAWVIPSATVLPNPVGTAPGWMVETDDPQSKHIFAMPGVPREMFRMWREQVLPRILERADQRIIDSTIIKTIGIGESAAEHLIHDLVLAADPVVATYAKDDGVHVRVTAVGTEFAETRYRRDAAVANVRNTLAAYIWGTDSDTLASVLAEMLSGSNSRLGILERGTGGAFAQLLECNLVSAQLVAEGRTLPVDLSVSADGGDEIALTDAQSAATFDGATLGMGLVFTGQRENEELLAGRLHLAVAENGGTPTLLPSLPLRSTLPEVQRRSSLHAIDMLRRHLAKSGHAEQAAP